METKPLGHQTPIQSSANGAGMEKSEPAKQDLSGGIQIQLAVPPKRRPKGPFLLLNNPATFSVIPEKNSIEAINRFVAYCSIRGKPAFKTLYTFRKADLDKRTVDRDSAIVDRIKFDIDSKEGHLKGSDDVIMELRDAMTWLDSRQFDYEINFSGNSGFGIQMLFPEADIKHPYKVVSMLYQQLSEMMDIAFDEAAMLGTQQKFRILNSQHQKSGLYAIPLTKGQAKTLTIEQIKVLAKTPLEQTEYCNPDLNVMFKEICEQYDNKSIQDFKPGKKAKHEKWAGFSKENILRPCTRLMVQNRIGGWTAMNIVAYEMINAGIEDGEIHDWARNLQGLKYVPDITQYHIDKIREKMAKGDLMMHGCGYIKRFGFCVNEAAINLSECRNMEKENELAQLAEKIKTLTTASSESKSLSEL